MKSAILAVVVAAGIGVLAPSSYAQEPKKVPLHPAAAGDASFQKGKVDLPSKKAAISGEPGAEIVKRDTGEAVPSGGTTTAVSQPN
jgi:hypothetical protein